MNKQEELFPKRDEVTVPKGQTDKPEPFQYFAAGIDPYKDLINDGSYAVLLQEGEGVDKGKLIAEYLGREDRGKKWEVQFPELIKEMQQYYGDKFLVKEKLPAIVSIDPGSSGSITVFQPTGEIISTKMPDTPKDVFDLLKEAKNNYSVTAYMEKVQGLPGMGGSPMFNFGKGYGHLEMALLALEIQTVTIRPQEWQKTLGIGTKGKTSTTEWKNKLKAKAQQLFPSVKVTLWNADALLIGWYAQNLKK